MGERVWVRDFRMRFPNKWIAGTVVARSGPLSYVVQVGSECWRRHQDQMRASDPHRNYEEETAAQTASHTAAQPAMQTAAQLSAPPAMQLTESIDAQESAPSPSEHSVVACMPQRATGSRRHVFFTERL